MTISEPEYKIESGLSSESYTIRQAFKTNNSVKIKKMVDSQSMSIRETNYKSGSDDLSETL